MNVTKDMLEAARQVLIPELKDLKDTMIAMEGRLGDRISGLEALVTGLEARVSEMSNRLDDHSKVLTDLSRRVDHQAERIDHQAERLDRVLEAQNNLVAKIGEWLATSHTDLQDLKRRVEALERKVA